ncbi:NupC/NupG family nucleoside CNT transporter [Pseudomonas oryzihabitans]|uniref:Nucleoside permease n=1 Tax=Pseudomonas oryzihabitans TaxID=47885 RepID=A0AAJ2BL06_9PSED|nr:NupC/NupG family nucleoside CNT transporter [Pseudomonas psychrotolerans]MDR6234830.1 CNT family concentrative nucleoside transporter [Pseudomonas psychrotolerans]MDR6355996.1 CNT family concentrative nucleoside transporter [Pseudomonas psychrotolerans]
MISVLGMLLLVAIAILFSRQRRAIRLRTVLVAFLLQAGLGLFVLYIPWGQQVLGSVSGAVASLQLYADKGIEFLFGGLAGPKMFEYFGNGGFVFAVRVLPLIVFFGSLIAVLYYLGIMGWIIRLVGGALHALLGTSRVESTTVTATLFLGQSEMPLVVRPFIAELTRSELFAIMVGGFAAVAGSVLLGYAGMGVDLKYLIAASFMAAPGGLLMAKLMEPETEQPRDQAMKTLGEGEERPSNVIDAAAEGAQVGLRIALAVGAMLLAFIALIALLNGILGWCGAWFGVPQLSMQLVLGYLLAPVAFLIGVPWSEAVQAGGFIGQKLVLNEFVAYADLSAYLDPVKAAAAGVQPLSAHTQVIVTFALCGFANLSSIAIQLGGLGGIAPQRRHELAQLGLRAMLGGTLANLMSAALAGFFISL